MTLEGLVSWFAKHRKDKNYQLRDLSDEEFESRAKKSWNRLPLEHQKKVLNTCKLAKLYSGNEQTLTFIINARFLAQTNLFSLCRLLEKYKDVSEKEYTYIDGTVHSTHEGICNEFFVRKDPTKKTFKDFAKEYIDKKERLLLVPRGGFKSSIDMADTVQWVICFPEVTILILTGVLDLAKDFVKEIKSHFEFEDGEMEGENLFQTKKAIKPKQMSDGSFNLFQVLFPEHCIPKEEGKSTEYQSPACSVIEKECTVFAASIDQNLSGWHVGVMKLDDVVTNENSRTVDRIRNINKQVSINNAMLHPYGFFDKIGTWYDCLVGTTPILMSDWSQKPIQDIKVGDTVVGWQHEGTKSKLVPAKVKAAGRYVAQPVNQYRFESGRTVVATPNHQWWSRKCTYGKLGFDYNRMKYVRRVLIPAKLNESRDAGWLAAIFDGEGSFQKNVNHPSGVIKVTQTKHNPGVIEKIRETLTTLKFNFVERWKQPKNPKWKLKCDFVITKGWRERYRFLAEIAPTKIKAIASSLWGQLVTEEDKLVSVENAGNQDIYWFETETGNYIADGCCSKNSEDTYGQTIKYVAKCEKDGEDVKTKVYIRPAWWANENSRKAGKVEEEMVESDYDFWFNEEGQLTYKFLRGKKLEDAEGFAIKYLNDPTQAHRIKFPRELLIRRTIASNMLPQQGMIVTTVDTAYSTKSWADYTVILTSLIYGGRFYVIDMKRGRYNEFELPQLIAQNALQWKPKRICIEDSVGVKWLGREVYREMDRLKLRVPIEFVPLGQGNKSNAKNMKAKPVLRLLGDERLLFANQCVGLEELYTELEKFDTAAATHDDIVSALSILVDQFASYAEMEGRMSSVAPDFISDPKMKQQYDHIYGAGVFEKMLNQKAFEASLEHQDMSMSDAMKAEREASGEYYDPLEAAGLW
jgi:phage terminase large subunit-like protein